WKPSPVRVMVDPATAEAGAVSDSGVSTQRGYKVTWSVTALTSTCVPPVGASNQPTKSKPGRSTNTGGVTALPVGTSIGAGAVPYTPGSKLTVTNSTSVESGQSAGAKPAAPL